MTILYSTRRPPWPLLLLARVIGLIGFVLLKGGGQATPMTYEVNGKQHAVIPPAAITSRNRRSATS